MEKKIFYVTRDSFINQGLVFFGAMANKMYIKYLKKFEHHRFKNIPDFDVLSEDPHQSAVILKEQLQNDVTTGKLPFENILPVQKILNVRSPESEYLE